MSFICSEVLFQLVKIFAISLAVVLFCVHVAYPLLSEDNRRRTTTTTTTSVPLHLLPSSSFVTTKTADRISWIDSPHNLTQEVTEPAFNILGGGKEVVQEEKGELFGLKREEKEEKESRHRTENQIFGVSRYYISATANKKRGCAKLSKLKVWVSGVEKKKEDDVGVSPGGAGGISGREVFYGGGRRVSEDRRQKYTSSRNRFNLDIYRWSSKTGYTEALISSIVIDPSNFASNHMHDFSSYLQGEIPLREDDLLIVKRTYLAGSSDIPPNLVQIGITGSQ